MLKSPQHLEQLRPLIAVFPDACLVQTHRDPVRVTASTCTMVAYLRRIACSRVDPLEIGRYWAARIEQMLRASVRDREAVLKDQMLDVQFAEFMADEVGTALRVCAFAGLSAGEAERNALGAYQDANPRGRHGSLDYRLDDFGLDAAERRRALHFYQERFRVADE